MEKPKEIPQLSENKASCLSQLDNLNEIDQPINYSLKYSEDNGITVVNDKNEVITELQTDSKEMTIDLYFSDSERVEEKVKNVTPTHSPIEMCCDRKVVLFNECSHTFNNQSPLIYSGCCSLSSLDSESDENQLNEDNPNCVLSFSNVNLGKVLSPIDLPILQAHLVKLPKDHEKINNISEGSYNLESKKKSLQNEVEKSVFEDDLAVFKEESTPIKLESKTASSLSSLTIDDDEDSSEKKITEDGTNKIKCLHKFEPFEDNTYFSADEEKILDECIRKGIAKLTKKCVDKNLSLTNNQTVKTSDFVSDISNIDFDDNSEITLEEEKLLDECIRRGIAKVTKQNINDVRSKLRSNIFHFHRDLKSKQIVDNEKVVQ